MNIELTPENAAAVTQYAALARFTPAELQRERYKEEWQSPIDEIPGDICKIVIAPGFVPTSKMMSSEMANKRPRVINAQCHIGARVELRAAAIVRANSRGVLTVGLELALSYVFSSF
jgi:hypothetical protein